MCVCAAAEKEAAAAANVMSCQANTYEELPEQVIGAARLAHVEPATAVVPDLSDNTRADKNGGDASSEDDLSKKIN